MSRSGYSDGLDEWALIRWRGAVKSAIRGARGQAFLREMAAALDAMPEKKLIADEVVTPSGDVCAMGAVCQKRGIDVSDLPATYDFEYEYSEATEDVGERLGIARALAKEIAYENDEGTWAPETPEQRWTRMRAWVARHITPNSNEPSHAD